MHFLNPDWDRRHFMSAAGLGLAGAALAPAAAVAKEYPAVDLNDRAQNLNAYLKIRGDLSGKPYYFAFPGEVWAMIPDEGNFKLFKTFGFGASRMERIDEGWRLYHREVLYYRDPDTDEILTTWKNPLTEQTVKVIPVLNDPVNRVLVVNPDGTPERYFPPLVNGDTIIYQLSFFMQFPNRLSRKDYPLSSQSDLFQGCELWGFIGSKKEVADPNATSTSCTISWSRVAQWAPFMQMGNRPGVLVYHNHALKLMNGIDDLPADIRAYTEKHHPKYLSAPKKWVEAKDNMDEWTYYKKIVGKQRA